MGADLEQSLLSFEKLDRASPDLWPEQMPGVAEFAASFKSPITSSPPKWMAELEKDDIDMLKELGSLTTANLMEKVRGLQNLAYQLGLDECAAEPPPKGIRTTESQRSANLRFIKLTAQLLMSMLLMTSTATATVFNNAYFSNNS
ncbi:protein lin-52 homolog isoform X2 [Rhincodon typus]|uniref:protein lin-52 homolog isoform X2 n=1 Tax=Rhincodon typus TaxID=259920 RepID=UPI00202EDE28|nr:protein lin-52 homolog isoform X2 [Rhincodon typus]